jgi:hypothetical protein
MLVQVPGPALAADAGSRSAGLREVLACPTVSSCWAVSQTDPNSLLHWNGHAWSAMTVPLPSGPAGSRVDAAIHDIVCLSVHNCWAVGSWGYEVGSTVGASYLSEHWNGSAWHYVAAALPASAVGSPDEPALEGISCISGSNCWAVGSAGGAPAASHWDGHRWTVRTVQPLPSQDSSTVLFDVSCARFDCWAVGTGHGYQFGLGGGSSSSYVVLHLVKGTWVKVPSPVLPVSAMEDSVHIACPAANSCWVVGTRYDPKTYDPRQGLTGQLNYVVHWNGKRWAAVTVPSPGGHVITDLNGFKVLPASALLDVSCSGVDDCWAVGAYTHAANPPLVRGQVLHWNGTRWSILPSPKPVGAIDAGLVGVDCPHGRGCAVVGYGVTDTVVDVLLAHRSAGHWAA